ncbi:MAG: hypothetical protein HYU37_05360 [Acidobacteria bacterium]|nr:hypothetical protein [Acidobacteriota bacterium]
MRWSLSSILVLLAFVLSILSAVAAVPLWVAVMLLALAHLVGEHGFIRLRT